MTTRHDYGAEIRWFCPTRQSQDFIDQIEELALEDEEIAPLKIRRA